MGVIARGWLERCTGPLLEQLIKADTPPIPVHVGPPPTPNRARFPYQGTIVFAGLTIFVENVAGSVRSGVAADGTPWSVRMPAHYGEFAHTLGMDGDPVDVFVGPDAGATMAYVVHQKVPGSQRMDEDKVVLGCRTAEEAERLYRSAYSSGGFFSGITPWPLDELAAELRREGARGKRLDTPPWLRQELAKGGVGPKEKMKPEEPDALTDEDEEILDAVWARVRREREAKASGEAHKAAGVAALQADSKGGAPLEKAVRIANQPGLVLRPSRTNPRTRRWTRLADDPEAREEAKGQKPLPFGGGRSASTDGAARPGIPEATVRQAAAAARTRATPKPAGPGITFAPGAREAVAQMFEEINQHRDTPLEVPSDRDVAALAGADIGTAMVRVEGDATRLVVHAWLNPEDSPYSGKASSFQVTARDGKTYEVRAPGDGTYAVHETEYGADPKTQEFAYKAKPSPLFVAKWKDADGAIAWVEGWPTSFFAPFGAVSSRLRGTASAHLTRIIKPDEDEDGALQVYNALFELPKSIQGQGAGVECLARQVEAAGRNGVRVLHCNAARSDGGSKPFVGYYVWARLGYNAALYDSRFEEWNTRGNQRPPNGEETMHDLMASEQGRQWWKEHGDSWDAEFDPRPGSASRRVLSEYLEAKGSALRLSKGELGLLVLGKAVRLRNRPGLVLRASKSGVKRWQRATVDTKKHTDWWRDKLDGMIAPARPATRTHTLPNGRVIDNARAEFTQDDADRYHKRFVAEGDRHMKALRHVVDAAVLRLGARWPGIPLRIEQHTPGDEFASEASSSAEVYVGAGKWAPSFFLTLDDGKPWIGDLLEAGDRESFDDPRVEAAYFELVEAIRNPNKKRSNRTLTLYTARPVADRDRYENATDLPHGVFLTSDPDRAHGLAHDLSGGKADRDVYAVRVRERDLVKTLDTGRVRDFQVVGKPGRAIPVVSMERLEKGGRLRILLKATIRTPKGADGKVDYDAVPVGSSIWVTVTDPTSPLHGRPILISKRPDKTFALVGGSGAKHIKARKHLVMQGGEVRGAQVDEERAKARKEAAERNAPRKAALADLRKKLRTETKAAEKSFMEALGIKRKGLDDEQKAEVHRTALEHAKTTLGLDDEAAASFAKHLTAGVAKKEEQRVQREAVRRLDVARGVAAGMPLAEAEALAGPAEAPRELHVAIPDNFGSMTEPEREAAILGQLDAAEADQHLAEAEAERFEPPEAEPEPEPAPPNPAVDPQGIDAAPSPGLAELDNSGAAGAPVPHQGDVPDEGPEVEHAAAVTASNGPTPPVTSPPVGMPVTLGAVEAPPSIRPLANVAAAQVAVDRFKDIVAIQKSAKEIADQIEELPEAELAAPAALDELRLHAQGVSDEEVDRYLAQYRERAMAPPDSGFYDALSPHWNETEGNKLNGAVVSGAGTAIAAIVGDEIAARYDVRRLVDALGPEAASLAVVQRMREEMDPAQFKAFRDKLETANATGIQETEQRAMARHRELQKQAADLEAQVDAGDLQSRATIAMLRARNLLEQRENLGGALGSMQASASMYHFADVAGSRDYGKRHEVKINVGPSRLALDDKLKRLGSFKKRIEYDVRTGGYSIVTDTASLRKFVTRTEANKADAEKWRAVKSDRTNTRLDDEGREWAEGYSVPGFRSHFGSEDTLPPDQKHLAGQAINFMAEQRNNIEWLHGAGGGLVTMATGGGKTLVSLAVAAKHLHANPKGRHLRIVPDGREEQWASEVSNFTVHRPVVIPAKATKEERHAAIAGAPEGSIVIIGHSPAGKHDYNALGVHQWDSIGIDEPQELRAKSGSGKLSAGAKRIFKLDAPHRHALTATPATDNPVEAYDIVNWTRPGVLGYRTRFASSFAGFGGGTNAQDEAMTRMLYRELEPHVSGERLVPPHYGIHHNDVKVGMTDGQKARQQAIESQVEAHIEQRVQEAYQKKRDGIRGYAETSFAALRAKATEKAMGEMEARHRANLGGGDHADNAKLRALAAQLDKADKDHRHVVFVDSADQRKAVVELLKARGVPAADVKNITSAAKNATVVKDGQVIGAIEERKRAWKGAKGGYLLIDQSSASGHNLAEGDHLHVLGNPDDAAQLLQVHGRLGRANRVGDFAIHTYRYEDSPFEHHKWNRLERQLKVLRATAPGMFVQGARTTRTETRLDKAVRGIRMFLRWGRS